MTIAVLQLIAGFICAGFGGEAFVRACVNSAVLLRIPSAIVAITIAAFATSSPELSVAVNAALAGTPQIALGDALGSNIINVALVLGLVLCFGGLAASRQNISRDWLLALFIPILVGVMASDGIIGMTDGIVLLGMFAVWLSFLVVTANNHRRAAAEAKTSIHKGNTVILLLMGLGLLMLAGTLIVSGAKAVGSWLGWSPFITGVTLVALGTSMPELAASLIARLRGHDDIGLNTVVGSNIFNLLCIVAIAAIIHPIAIDAQAIVGSIGVGLVALVFVFPNARGFIPRWRSIPLLVVYAAYVLSVLA
ncbi:MAG: sodium:calcium antiporter [Bdellovibrionales bacterium]